MKKVILIADDSPTIRKFVSFILALRGFEIIQVCDGMEALEKLPAEKIDLIITDINMPNINGFELIKSIRENPDMKEIPIIILSALSSYEEIEQGMLYGANLYLTKPLDPERIVFEVSKYLN